MVVSTLFQSLRCAHNATIDATIKSAEIAKTTKIPAMLPQSQQTHERVRIDNIPPVRCPGNVSCTTQSVIHKQLQVTYCNKG
jgi:hypothetical protein